MNPWDKNLREQVAERDKKIESLEQELMISQGRSPNEQFKASPSDREYYDKVYEKLKINKEAGKDPVDVFKDGIQGELFSRKPPDRGALKHWTKGKNPWDDAGGEPIDALKQFPALYKIIMRDAAASAPRYIRSGPPPNVINKAPHIDSLFIDRMLRDYRNKQEPQLPSFV